MSTSRGEIPAALTVWVGLEWKWDSPLGPSRRKRTSDCRTGHLLCQYLPPGHKKPPTENHRLLLTRTCILTYPLGHCPYKISLLPPPGCHIHHGPTFPTNPSQKHSSHNNWKQLNMPPDKLLVPGDLEPLLAIPGPTTPRARGIRAEAELYSRFTYSRHNGHSIPASGKCHPPCKAAGSYDAGRIDQA